MNHSQDLTVGVMFGLAWYYLLAAMLNAGAAAYLSYGELVSEGASRVGLGPKTRRFPPWLLSAYIVLYGLAVLMILGRHALPGAVGVAYGLCAAANALLNRRLESGQAARNRAGALFPPCGGRCHAKRDR